MSYILIVMIWHGVQLEQIEQGRYPSAGACVEAGFKLKHSQWFCISEDELHVPEKKR